MSPRLTDWSLAYGVALAFASGLVSLVSGRPEDWWVFALHGVVGLWLLPLTLIKLWRVWPRLSDTRCWDRRTVFGLLTTLLVLLALGTGLWWTTGGTLVVAGYNLLNWHIVFGLVLVVGVSAHMIARARPLRKRDVQGRRQLLRLGAIVAGGALAWLAKDGLVRAADTPASARRFTGSREIGSFGGNGAFPYVSWMADQPHPVEISRWRLRITGAVAHPYTLRYDDLQQFADELEATLDCTGGFFSTQRWRGAMIGRLLDRAEPLAGARWVSFVSVTGYRWSIPLDEARTALLATQLEGAPLAHGHGALARLVAPGRRGFEWVKWVEQIEVRREADPGQLVAIYASGFTQVGSGE
jgi:DMSO/TMAO reductase YedYZ molybdopterin-dependent catalytic subunit